MLSCVYGQKHRQPIKKNTFCLFIFNDVERLSSSIKVTDSFTSRASTGALQISLFRAWGRSQSLNAGKVKPLRAPYSKTRYSVASLEQPSYNESVVRCMEEEMCNLWLETTVLQANGFINCSMHTQALPLRFTLRSFFLQSYCKLFPIPPVRSQGQHRLFPESIIGVCLSYLSKGTNFNTQ